MKRTGFSPRSFQINSNELCQQSAGLAPEVHILGLGSDIEVPPKENTSQLWPELWVSLASLLRSYTAAHGLNRKQQATVELGEESIIVRAGERWLNLNRHQADITWSRENSSDGILRFTIEGKLKTEDREEEMDMQAEAWARELML